MHSGPTNRSIQPDSQHTTTHSTNPIKTSFTKHYQIPDLLDVFLTPLTQSALLPRPGKKPPDSHAHSNNSAGRLAGPIGGGCGSSPRCLSIFLITTGSSIKAISLSLPPHAHCSMSISNTRLGNRAHVLRTGLLCSRAQVVNRDALQAALRSGRLGGFTLDPRYEEPGYTDDELLQFNNVILTPHVTAMPCHNVLEDFRDLVLRVAQVKNKKTNKNKYLRYYRRGRNKAPSEALNRLHGHTSGLFIVACYGRLLACDIRRRGRVHTHAA